MTNELTPENIDACMYLLVTYIEGNKLNGTSISNSFGEIEIKGINYQFQMRLESDVNMFIPSDGYAESESILRNK